MEIKLSADQIAAVLVAYSIPISLMFAMHDDVYAANGAATAAPDIGVYLGAGCTGSAKLSAYEHWLGRPVDRVLDFAAVDSWAGAEASLNWLGRCWSATGKKLTISLPMLVKNDGGGLAAGAAGRYDANFVRFANSLVHNGYGNAVVRIGWEFNAGWYPWDARRKSVDWIAYWRRIVMAMRTVPGAAFQFDWCPIIGDGASSPESAYPGDDVVDIIGADAYNQSWRAINQGPEVRWQQLKSATYGLEWQRAFAMRHGKLMVLDEWGTGFRPDGHGGGDDPVFIALTAAWIRANGFSYHVYWDYPAADYNAKLSDGSKPLAARQFLQEVRSP